MAPTIPPAATSNIPLKYAEAVNFARLQVDGEEGQALWPCVVFENKLELRKELADLVRTLRHGAEICRTLVQELQEDDAFDWEDADADADADNDEEFPNYAAYLLGEKIPSHNRLMFVPGPLPLFQAQYAEAQQSGGGLPGFKGALSEALNLTLGTEFSRARLRFSVIKQDNGQEIAWPCILFDDYHLFLNGLKARGLLLNDKDELLFAREYIEVVVGGVLPPYVYHFGEKPDGVLVGGFEYITGIGNSLIDQYGNRKFWDALHQALQAVRPPSPKNKTPPKAVPAQNSTTQHKEKAPTKAPAPAAKITSKKRRMKNGTNSNPFNFPSQLASLANKQTEDLYRQQKMQEDLNQKLQEQEMMQEERERLTLNKRPRSNQYSAATDEHIQAIKQLNLIPPANPNISSHIAIIQRLMNGEHLKK